MKKIVCSLILAATIGTGVQAQETRPLHKGQNSVNLYYGVNVLKGFYKAAAPSDVSGLDISGFGPVGIVYEHMVTESIGMGAEFGYATTAVKWTDDWSDNGQSQLYTYEYRFSSIRAMIRANFHFAKTENFDAYFLISAGYKGNSYTFVTNDPFYDGGASIKGVVPFGLKPGLGLRYFFTENIGAHVEVAIGTPLICGGLSFRF